ncbi:MAG: hypothetical protein P8Y70_15785 [Candidatus Lokiarchaeota archaeon]
MVTCWYPAKNGKKVPEVMKTAPKLPEYIKKWQLFGTTDGKNGFKVYNLIMIEKGKSDEALIFIAKMQQHFITNVEGYTWKIEPLMSVKDSMKMFS